MSTLFPTPDTAPTSYGMSPKTSALQPNTASGGQVVINMKVDTLPNYAMSVRSPESVWYVINQEMRRFAGLTWVDSTVLTKLNGERMRIVWGNPMPTTVSLSWISVPSEASIQTISAVGLNENDIVAIEGGQALLTTIVNGATTWSVAITANMETPTALEVAFAVAWPEASDNPASPALVQRQMTVTASFSDDSAQSASYLFAPPNPVSEDVVLSKMPYGVQAGWLPPLNISSDKTRPFGEISTSLSNIRRFSEL